MSRPHYGWWGYVKDIIRRYPTLCEQEKALHAVQRWQRKQAIATGGFY